MSNNRHRSAPTSPIHNSNSTSSSSSSSTSSFSNNLNRSSNTNSSNNNNNRNNNNTRKHKGLFGFGSGNGGGGAGNINFLDQVAQFSNSLHDIFPNSGLISDMGKMLYKSCNSCGNSFSIFVRKKRCDNCMLQFCGSCMEFNDILRVYHCKRCLVFNEFPLSKDALNTLRVRDLKWYLTTHHISSETYSEKRELIDLIIESVNPPMPTSQSTPISPSTTGNSTSAASAAASASSQLNQSIPNSTLFNNNNNVQTNSETNHSNSNNAEEINVNSNSQSSTSTSTSIPLNQQQQQSYANVGSSAAASSYPSSSGTTGISSSHSHSHKPTLSSDLSASTTNLSTFNLTDINEESEIRNLSIRQLKLLLARNFVDFKGCVERDELINKAVLLWKDRQINKLKEENESEDCIIDENICKICMEHAIDCVLLECGHMLTCTNCGKILNECPVCRQFVSRVVHVFKA